MGILPRLIPVNFSVPDGGVAFSGVLGLLLGVPQLAQGHNALENAGPELAEGILLGLVLAPVLLVVWPALLGWGTCRLLRRQQPGYAFRTAPCLLLAILTNWLLPQLLPFLSWFSSLLLPVGGALLGYYLTRRPSGAAENL